jgi:hypothetical protein
MDALPPRRFPVANGGIFVDPDDAVEPALPDASTGVAMPMDRPDRHIPSRLDGFRRTWLGRSMGMFVLVGSLQAAPLPADLEVESNGPDWIDVRLEKVLRREDAGIPHCEAMVRHQRELAKVRDTIHEIVARGRAARTRCRQDHEPERSKACLDSLDPLRRQVADRVRGERRLQDSVGRHASACNSAAFKAWEDLEYLRHSSDDGIDSGLGTCADAPPPRASYDRLVEIEIASVWNQERRARERKRLHPKSSPEPIDTSASVAFRDKIHQYAKRKGASNPSAQTHFLLAVLDHREGREIQALARLRRIPARDSSTVWKAPVAMLYGQILSERSPDSAMALLRSDLPDSSLKAPARFLLGRIELAKGNLPQALEQFSDYLDLPPAPSPGSRPQAVGLAAHILSEQIRLSRRDPRTAAVREVLNDTLPRSARDTIALQVARNLADADDARSSIEILSSFQIDHPGTKLGDEARSLLSRVRRSRTGNVNP